MNRTWRCRRGVRRLALSGGLGPLVAPIAGGGAVAAAADPLDLHTATAEPLTALPGIGDAAAEQILKGRPAPRQDDLVPRKRLPPATSEQIQARLLATPRPARSPQRSAYLVHHFGHQGPVTVAGAPHGGRLVCVDAAARPTACVACRLDTRFPDKEAAQGGVRAALDGHGGDTLTNP